jgi:microcompartment protein CcmL/EutN
MAKNCIGLIEMTSIAAGFQTCDAMLKAADVEVVLSRSICSGKYMVLIRGDVAAVQSSVEAGCRVCEVGIIDRFVIPNVHESIFPAIAGTNPRTNLKALGILESFSVTSLIEGADAAAKSANVQLLEVRLAMALGGKAFVTLTGDVADVTAAVEAGARVIGAKGLLVNKVIIANPRDELLTEVI